MYKLDQDRATRFGINWMQLRKGQRTPEIEKFLDGFLAWESS